MGESALGSVRTDTRKVRLQVEKDPGTELAPGSRLRKTTWRSGPTPADLQTCLSSSVTLLSLDNDQCRLAAGNRKCRANAQPAIRSPRKQPAPALQAARFARPARG